MVVCTPKQPRTLHIGTVKENVRLLRGVTGGTERDSVSTWKSASVATDAQSCDPAVAVNLVTAEYGANDAQRGENSAWSSKTSFTKARNAWV